MKSFTNLYISDIKMENSLKEKFSNLEPERDL